MGRFTGVENVARVGIERSRRQGRRQQDAVAIDDVGPLGLPGRCRYGLGEARFVALFEDGDVGEASGDDEEAESEQRADHQKPVAAGFDDLLAHPLEAHAVLMVADAHPAAGQGVGYVSVPASRHF